MNYSVHNSADAGEGVVAYARVTAPGGTAMPHKYEREIEEILKNMQRNEPQPSAGERRSRGFPRPAGGSGFHLGLSASELLFLLGIAFALAGACAVWFVGNQGGTPISAVLGMTGFVLFI